MRKLFCNSRVLHLAVSQGLISHADLAHGIFLTASCGDYAFDLTNRAKVHGSDPHTEKMIADAFHQALVKGRVATWVNEQQGDLHKTLQRMNVVFDRTLGRTMKYSPEDVWPEFASLYAICKVLDQDGISEELELVSIFYIQKEKRKRCEA